MSEVLEWVANWSGLEEAHRIDPHVLCKGSHEKEEFWFLVSDDGWYGWFVAQYQSVLERKQLDEATHLIRRIGPRRSHFFGFDYRDHPGLVRGVFQLPIANEPRWEDDVPLAVRTLEEEWGTFLPFLRRIATGEAADGMVAEAIAAFAAIDAPHPKVLLRE
ncbi:MAG: hypothetical protein H0X11_06890 [Betaproteobacteria bacterium]|nr:hypothetical protein [Betaproteobacteria bacterium]